MSVLDVTRRAAPRLSHPSDRGASAWLWTAGSGLALVIFATAHVIAQHFVVHQVGGLRTYQEVVSYVAEPVMFVIECAFLFSVTIHGLLGVRSVVRDLDLSARTLRRLDAALWTLGTATIVYGLVLMSVLASRA